MTTYATSPGGSRDVLAADVFKYACIAFCVANAGIVLSAWLAASGPNDFVGVWAAGRLALDGQPQAAYDWSAHKTVEDLAAGSPFEGTYPWLYPPSFLLVATVLALVPYGLAHLMWPIVTSAAYLVSIRAIIQHRTAILLAAAFPGAMANLVAEQNGFLSAGLFGGALVLMERSPVLSGCLLGLLSYKPQFGVLIPLALIAGGRWRVLCSAAAVAVALAAVSWVAFGTATWAAFGSAIFGATRVVLADHAANWHKLQTVFGLVRALGGSETTAWSLQAATIVACAGLTWMTWHRTIAFQLQAAALVAASLLATPYMYIYDLVVLAIPMAFLVELGRTGGFRPGEIGGLAAVSLLVLSYPLVEAPVGLAATLIVTWLVARRAFPIGLRRRIARGRPPCDGQPSTEFPHVPPYGSRAEAAARLHREPHRPRQREAPR